MAALFREHAWGFAWGGYAYLLVATFAISAAPPHLSRAVALSLYCGALLLDSKVWKPTPGMEWFAPVFFLKLLVSHAASESPEKK